MAAFSLGARLFLGVNSRLALSLPQSYCLNPLCSTTAPSSEGAEAAPPQSTDLALLSKFGVNAITGRGYNPSVFSACKTSRKASSPCTVGFRAPPVADTARKASRCRPQVRERTAEARAAGGEGAEKCAQDAHSPYSLKAKAPLRALLFALYQVTILVAVSVPSSS